MARRSEPPAFRSLADELREEERLEAERLARIGTDDDPDIQAHKQREKIAAQLRLFRMTRGDRLDPVGFVVNLMTGQVAAKVVRAPVRPGYDYFDDRSYRTDPADFDWGRVRAKEACEWLASPRSRAEKINTFYDLDYPDWLFGKSDEPIADRRDVVKAARRKSYWSLKSQAVGDFFDSLGQGIVGIFWLILALASLAFMAYGAWFLLSGVRGLLEFGRRQL